jgi:hypothetical protein
MVNESQHPSRSPDKFEQNASALVAMVNHLFALPGLR